MALEQRPVAEPEQHLGKISRPRITESSSNPSRQHDCLHPATPSPMTISVTGKQSREARASPSGMAAPCNGLSGDVLESPRVPVGPCSAGQGIELPIRETNAVVSVATISLSLPLAIGKILLEQGYGYHLCTRARHTEDPSVSRDQPATSRCHILAGCLGERRLVSDARNAWRRYPARLQLHQTTRNADLLQVERAYWWRSGCQSLCPWLILGTLVQMVEDAL